jgi:hypothetical protein
MRKVACVLALIALVAIAYGADTVQCNLQDTQRAIGNSFTAFSSSTWTQDTTSDFNAGLISQVRVTATGTVTLAYDSSGRFYVNSGSLASQVFDSGQPGAQVDIVSWVRQVSSSTSVTMYIRASNTAFLKNNNTIPWVSIGATSPVTSGLPSGRYIQWRAVLATNKKQDTPVLDTVQVLYH